MTATSLPVNGTTTDFTHPALDLPVAPRPADVRTDAIDPVRLRRAFKAYATRFVADAIEDSAEGFHLESGAGVRPRAGDVVLARVTEIGKHTRLEGPASRRQLLFPGQEILVAYGDRYAPDQFLAHVPDSLAPTNLVGIASFPSSYSIFSHQSS